MFEHKGIYKPEKAVAQARFSLLHLSHTDMNVSILDSKSKELKFNKFYWIVALVAALFVGVSNPTNAQCKKSSSTCNLTTLRNAFTTNGYQELGCGADSCSIYFVDPTLRTSTVAQNLANSLGANLTSILDQAANDSIVVWLNGLGYTGSARIGFSDASSEGKFVWADGQDTTYKNWLSGNPNGGTAQNCVALQLNGSDSGLWVDTTCSALMRSVIKVSLCMSISVSDTSLCQSDSLNLVPIITSGSPSYTFSWSPASTDSINKVSPSSSTTFSLTVTDRYGCSATDTAFVRLDTLPTISLVDDTVCISDTITYNLGSTGYTNYLWSTGDTIDSIRITAPGTYWGRRTNSFGCIATDTFQLSNFALPTFSLGNDTNVCSGDTITYTAPFTHPSFSYKWQDNSTGNSIKVDTTVQVALEVTDSNGCKFTNGPQVTYRVKPTENIGNDTTICQGESISFTGLSTGTLYDRWIINYNQPNKDTVESFSFGPNDSLNSVVYYGEDVNGCPAFDTIIVSRDTLPIINLGNDTSICMGDSITIDAGAGMRTYTWNTSQSTRTIKVGSTNSYLVFVTDSNGCSGNDIFILGIDTLPEFEILRNGLPGDTSICTNDSVLLTVDTLSSYQYSWNGSPFTNGDDSNYVNTASQNIVVIRDTNQCEFSDTLTVSLDSLPVVNLRGDTTFCTGDSILLSVNPDTNYHHIWDGISMGITDTMWVSVAKTYEVELVDRNTTCKSSDTVRIQLDTIPIINLGGDTTFCAGDTLSLDAGPGMLSYSWSKGDTTQSVRYDSAGVYTVNVVDSNLCKSSAFRRVFMSQLPTPNLGPDKEFCAGSAVNEIFNAGGGYAFYSWSTTKSGSDTTAQRDTITAQGTYSVTVTDTVGCKAADTISINANFLPSIELGPDTFFCTGDKFNFLIGAGPGYVKYEWFDFTDFPNVVQLASTGQILLVSDSASRIFCRITDGNGCTNQDTISINEMPLPVVDIGVTDFYCEAERSIFFDSLKADPANLYQKYEWSTGDTAATYIAQQGGVYTVTVTANNGCKNTSTKEIIEVPQPTVDFSGDTLYCEGAPVLLDAYTDGYLNYYWYKEYNVSGISDSLMNPLLEPIDSGWYDTTYSKIALAQEGDFKVIMKYGQYPGCADSAFATIRKDVNPVINFGIRNGDTTLCQGQILEVSPNFSYSSTEPNSLLFEWQDGTTDSLYYINETGLYQLIMTNDCGADIVDLSVTFEDCSNIWIPNTFTPNGDGDNERWSIKSIERYEDFEITVFDNMGRVVWETTLPGVEWDGTHITNGEELQIGTYIYRLRYRSKNEIVEGLPSAPWREVTGEVHLLR